MDVGTANVPAFLTKLWKLVEDPAYSDLISWSSNGRSFVIRNPARFSKELLPLYFKHNNMASFIRQLNMYGFRKLTSIENSGLRSERDEMEFYHQYFLKQQENLLEYIKRKASSSNNNSHGNGNGNHSTVGLVNGSTRDEASCSAKIEEVHELLSNVMQRQDSHENFRLSVQNEYSHLWKEIAYLRQQNAKQQTIVQRLIQFLMSLVQNQNQLNNLAGKRKQTLMIDGVDGTSRLQTPAKRLNVDVATTAGTPSGTSSSGSSSSGGSPCDTIAESNVKRTNGHNHHRSLHAHRSEEQIKSGIMDAITSGLSNGPVIHDVTDDVIEAELEEGANSDPIISMSTPAEMAQQQHGQITPPPPIFQDLDFDILTQVLGLAGQQNPQQQSDRKSVPALDPEQLLMLQTATSSLNAKGLNHKLHRQPDLSTSVNNSHHHQHHQHQQASQQQQPTPQHQASASDYWNPHFETLAAPTHTAAGVPVSNAHSPTAPSIVSVPVPEIVEPPDFLLDTSPLLEQKEDLTLLPGISDVVNGTDGLVVLNDHSSRSLASPYGQSHD